MSVNKAVHKLNIDLSRMNKAEQREKKAEAAQKKAVTAEKTALAGIKAQETQLIDQFMANPTTDPQAVPQSQVYGRVVHRLPAVGRAMVAATSPQARLVLLALLILVVAPELVALCGPGAPVGRHRRHHRTGAGPRAAQPVTAVPSR